MRNRVLALVVVLLAALAGCTSSGGRSSASRTQSAATQWADTVSCPSTVDALEAAAGVPAAQRTAAQVGDERPPSSVAPAPVSTPSRPGAARPGVDSAITPAGPVLAVVRCDETQDLVAAEDGTSVVRTAVQRTALTDPQPVSWFADGDHWPRRAGEPIYTPDASLVTLHYASGPDVVVTKAVRDGGTIRYDNGTLRCDVVTDSSAPAVTNCARHGGGASYVASVRPVAAGAPPVDCPSADAIDEAAQSPRPATSPRPGAEATTAPSVGLVVAVTCGNSLGAGPLTVWGAEAVSRFAPTATPTRTATGDCLSFGPPCNGVVEVTHLGYLSGPSVRLVSRSDDLSGQSWLRHAAGLRGGITNGVIACRYTLADVSPREVAGCLPFARATAGVVPAPSGSPVP